MPPVVDWHAHWIPPEVAELFEKRETPPRIVRDGSARVFQPRADESLPVKEHQLDIAARLREMAAAGVDRQVLSTVVLFGAGFDRLPPDLEETVVTACNEGLARLARERGDHFSALAMLPVHNPGLAPSILERAVREQGLLGATLPAEAFSDKDSASAFRDVFAVASTLGTHLFVHPGAWRRPDEPDDEAAMIRRRAVRFQNDLTAAALTFEYTDFLAPYPDATVHLANLGGAIALFAERISATAKRMGLPPDRSHGRPRRIVVDSASFGPHGLALAAATLGGGRILLGSDSPALTLSPAVETIRTASLPDGLRRAILEGVAATTGPDTAP